MKLRRRYLQTIPVPHIWWTGKEWSCHIDGVYGWGATPFEAWWAMTEKYKRAR
jgi:hypothetical protein